MTRQNWTIGLVAAAFTVSLAPGVWAQDNRGPQGGGEGSRPSNGASTGSAGPRGGDGGSSAGGGSSSSSAGSSSSSGMGASGGGVSGGMTGYSPAREHAPERPGSAYGGDRRGNAGEGRATPRGSSAASGGEATRGAGGSNSMYYGGETARDRAPVPAYSRPRDGRTVTGAAGERTGPPSGGGGGGCVGRDCGGYYPIYDPYYYYGYYDPYYYGYGFRYSNYWMPGYGFGFGYLGYDPFLFGGYYDPYAYAYGSGQASGGYGLGQYKGVGALRLKVKPTNAQVYIDGYYVGVVDAFDGTFQKLEIEAGSHRVEVKAEGFEPVQFDVMVQPGETVTYKGELPRIK